MSSRVLICRRCREKWEVIRGHVPEHCPLCGRQGLWQVDNGLPIVPEEEPLRLTVEDRLFLKSYRIAPDEGSA